MERINVFSGMFSSGLFMGIIISTVAFQAVIVEFLGTFADTVPLSWNLWLASVLMGAVSLIIGVLLKCIPVTPSKNTATIKNHDGYEQLPSGPDLA